MKNLIVVAALFAATSTTAYADNLNCSTDSLQPDKTYTLITCSDGSHIKGLETQYSYIVWIENQVNFGMVNEYSVCLKDNFSMNNCAEMALTSQGID